MKRRCYCILFILFTTLSCCKRNNNAPSVFTEASYPLAVGDWWQYLATYCVYGGVDTITLSVASMTSSGPYTNYKCYYLYHGAVMDSGYFQQSDTSLSFTNAFPYPAWGAFPNFHIKFPVAPGTHWPGPFYPNDSVIVVGVADSCHYGISFGSCYTTYEAYNLHHNFMVNKMTLTPHLGMVNQSIDYVSDTAGGGFGVDICQAFLLLDYHLQ